MLKGGFEADSEDRMNVLQVELVHMKVNWDFLYNILLMPISPT